MDNKIQDIRRFQKNRCRELNMQREGTPLSFTILDLMADIDYLLSALDGGGEDKQTPPSKWTEDRPDENGIYWHRQPGALPEVLLVHSGFVYDFGDTEPTSIGFFDGRGEWFGPIHAPNNEDEPPVTTDGAAAKAACIDAVKKTADTYREAAKAQDWSTHQHFQGREKAALEIITALSSLEIACSRKRGS